jgi:HEXXH motif-containing protein
VTNQVGYPDFESQVAPNHAPLLAEIYRGPIGADAMRLLRGTEQTKRYQLLVGLLREIRKHRPVRESLPDVEEPWQLLLRVEDTSPGIVDELVMFPSVGLWIRRALDKARDDYEDTPSNRADVGVVHAIAAAAAIRAGIGFSLPVPVVQGVVSLPTVGQFDVAEESADYAVVDHDGSATTPNCRGAKPGSFRAVRRHRAEAAGMRLDVVLDDIDPHRAFTEEATTPAPLSDSEFRSWSAQLDDAWSILVNWNSAYAAELSRGLASIIPLTREGRLVGASSAAAFGAISLSEKPSANELADALVHELQHSKLNAVFEMVNFHEAHRCEYFYAPWRDDPRPLDGVLHGIYAFTSVVEFWHDRRDREPGTRTPNAESAFVLRALQVRMAIEDVTASDRLNEQGTRFLNALSDRLAKCEVALTTAERTGPVARALADHRARWQAEHGEVRSVAPSKTT